MGKGEGLPLDVGMEGIILRKEGERKKVFNVELEGYEKKTKVLRLESRDVP